MSGLSDFTDYVGNKLEGAVKGGEKALGSFVDTSAHGLGWGLNELGLHKYARKVESFGDHVADHLGVQIPEQELGESDVPSDLVHGDVKGIQAAAKHLHNFSSAFQETSRGLRGLDTDHWKGEAADAFHHKFAPHPAQWSRAADACEVAAKALSAYADTVHWAQGQAQRAIDTYQKAKTASDEARDAYNKKVEAYNKALSDNRKQDSGAQPVDPGPFHDPGEAGMKEAVDILHEARRQRDTQAAVARKSITEATKTAPKEPTFLHRMEDDYVDGMSGETIFAEHFVGGFVKGLGDMVKFARSVSPTDPYNLSHPWVYLDHVNTVDMGLLHAANHPMDLVKSIIGSGWSTDPGQAFGRLMSNLVTVPATDGASATDGLLVDAAKNAPEAAVQDASKAASQELAERAAAQSTRFSEIRNSLQGGPFGLREPKAIDQVLLEKAMPRDAAGQYQKFADPRDNWFQLQNDGGPTMPGRSNNCVDTGRAFYETWHGNPQVSAPRTLDPHPEEPYDRVSGERNAVQNVEYWTGARLRDSGAGPQGFQQIAHELQQTGHGASSVIFVDWPGGGGHVFNAVNYRGEVLWIDAQSRVVSAVPIHVNNVRVQHVTIGANRQPVIP
ncbi:putative T7SS-secreted protein [Streptomyces silvisoli]|uniref:Toxin glutamine deamidase domain-containing protein n=1 Tax=Streptomyces silvisoli TaxID=3034235 RepID=A0ABT5ZQF1_9ACTN|nr:toxin glutamine deamidase domain-containing protein [Streptomyces silvisoli]MDF3292037.1 toxin glutamine deamidase domain-containing protein [Streptomyces silvisoli]